MAPNEVFDAVLLRHDADIAGDVPEAAFSAGSG